MIIVNTDTIVGKEITKTPDMARGITIQARHIDEDIMRYAHHCRWSTDRILKDA